MLRGRCTNPNRRSSATYRRIDRLRDAFRYRRWSFGIRVRRRTPPQTDSACRRRCHRPNGHLLYDGASAQNGQYKDPRSLLCTRVNCNPRPMLRTLHLQSKVASDGSDNSTCNHPSYGWCRSSLSPHNQPPNGSRGRIGDGTSGRSHAARSRVCTIPPNGSICTGAGLFSYQRGSTRGRSAPLQSIGRTLYVGKASPGRTCPPRCSGSRDLPSDRS